MRFIVDAREAVSAEKAGKARWSFEFLRELQERPNVECTLLTRDDPSDSVRGHFARSHVLPLQSRGMRWHLRAARYALDHPTNIYVSPTSYIVPALLRGRTRCAVIVHDLIAFRSEPHNARATWIEKLTLPRIILGNVDLFTVSTSTTRDLIERFPTVRERPITAIFAGPSIDQPPVRVQSQRTILCVATLCPRKNQERLIRAFASLPETVRTGWKLTLAGRRGWQDEEIVRLMKRTPGVLWEKYISDERYKNLLSICSVFALPSLYEGFGMQILDALSCGIPVLTSNRGSLREVAGEGALYVDPESIPSIASGINMLLTDAPLREKLSRDGRERSAQFTWKKTVDLFLEAVQKPSLRYTAHHASI